MTVKVSRAALGLSVVVLGLSGCVPSPPIEVHEAGDLTLLTHPTTDVQLQSLAEGVLGTVGRCISIEIDGRDYLVVFPNGAHVDESGMLTLRHGDALELGQPATLGGGFHSLEMLDDAVERLIPEACLTDEIFFVSTLNAGPDAPR